MGKNFDGSIHFFHVVYNWNHYLVFWFWSNTKLADTFGRYRNRYRNYTLSPISPGWPPKNCTKKAMLFLASMGETGLFHDIFLNSYLGLSRSLRSNDWNFEAATSKCCNRSWKFGSSPRKGKVNLYMTNGSQVLIYLTLLYFLLHYLQECSKIWNVAKSNKSELCHTEVCLTFLRWGAKLTGRIAKFRGRSLKISTSIIIRPQRPRKA